MTCLRAKRKKPTRVEYHHDLHVHPKRVLYTASFFGGVGWMKWCPRNLHHDHDLHASCMYLIMSFASHNVSLSGTLTISFLIFHASSTSWEEDFLLSRMNHDEMRPGWVGRATPSKNRHREQGVESKREA